MNELEERMFRLSEALRGLEPENASRLRLALKFSREEQILDQMRETHKLLKDAQLSKAETEIKELIAKLQHLRNLSSPKISTSSSSWRGCARCARHSPSSSASSRKSSRELGWSRFALAERKRLGAIATRRPDLEALIRDQQAVIADTKNCGKGTKPTKDAHTPIREREAKARTAAAAAGDRPVVRRPSAAPPAPRRRPDG